MTGGGLRATSACGTPLSRQGAGGEDEERERTKASERQEQYRGNGGVCGVREVDLTKRRRMKGGEEAATAAAAAIYSHKFHGNRGPGKAADLLPSGAVNQRDRQQ